MTEGDAVADAVTRTVTAVAGTLRDARVELLVWFDGGPEPESVRCRLWPGAWPPACGDRLTSWRGTPTRLERPEPNPEAT